jgi:hypothetical protein
MELKSSLPRNTPSPTFALRYHRSSPIIVQVGGVHRLSEVIATIDDACRWW